MAKILLVEDDNNLREIYEARLQAEGYDIVSARDGEEALTVAMKERPDLIISDVMMPKISGFDMLDIIRSTEETKNAKVIMMTALSQAEDKERADKLGADRYLVKSQVTLEDVAKVAREVLSEDSSQQAPADTVETPQTTTASTPEPASSSPATEASQATPAPVAQPASPADNATPASATQPSNPIQDTPEPTAAVTSDTPQPPATSTTDVSSASDDAKSTVAMASVAPTTTSADDTKTQEAEAAVEAAGGLSVEDEQAAIAAQIESFIDTKQPTPQAENVEPTPVTPETATEETNEPKVDSTPSAEQTSNENEPAPAQAPDAPKDSSAKVARKVITPINNPTAGPSVDLEALAQKEAEKEEMAQIAKQVAEKNSDKAEELSAAAALRGAARSEKPTEEEIQSDTPQVNVSEDGSLQVVSEPTKEQTTEDSSTETTSPPQQTAEAPPETDESQKPVIPHTNGTNIDGVATPQQTQPQPVTEQPPQPEQNTQPEQSDKPDPNSIAL